MAIETRIKGVQVDQVLKDARKLTPRAFVPEFNAIGRLFRDFVNQGFETETDPYGNAWKPLAAFTVADKRSRGVADPFQILHDSGELSKSFQYRALANGVRVFSNHVFDDGTPADVHQEGDGVPRRMMVPDESLGFPSHWEDEAMKIIEDGVDRMFN